MSAVADAMKIARWNERHGTILGEIDDALDRMITATRYDEWDAGVAARVTAAALNLRDVAGKAFSGPRSGLARYDLARREGLICWLDAAELLIDAHLDGQDVYGDTLVRAGQLLDDGREHTSRATATANELIAAIRG